jgi:serine/threonine-protein kinase PknG
MEFRGNQSTYVASLPPVDETPLFQQYDSLYHLLNKCCAPDPADRFASIDELRTQLLGVLREVVARGRPGTALTSAASVLFESPETARPITEWSQLPRLREDTTDPQYGWISTLGADDARKRIKDLDAAPEDTAEVWLARCKAALELKESAATKSYAGNLLAADPWEWRALWMEALAAVQQDDWETAKASFNAVYQQVPGELAPKLALAFACEKGGQPEVAEGLYQTCASTDATYVAPSAFGMARVRAARKDTAGAVAALDLVPTTSRGYTESRQQRAEVLLAGSAQDLSVLDQALRTIEASSVDNQTRQLYTVRILKEALPVVAKNPPRKGISIGSVQASETGIRDGLENALRTLARETYDLDERVDLVNQANGVRNWSLT